MSDPIQQYFEQKASETHFDKETIPDIIYELREKASLEYPTKDVAGIYAFYAHRLAGAYNRMRDYMIEYLTSRGIILE